MGETELKYDCLVKMISREREYYKHWCNRFIILIVCQWVWGGGLLYAHQTPIKDPACQDIAAKYQKILQHEGNDPAVDYYPPAEDKE